MKKLLSTKRFYFWAILILTVIISTFAINFPSWSTVNAQEFKETSKQTYSNTKNAPRSLDINNQSQSESDIYQSEDPNSVVQIDPTIKKETTENLTLNSQQFSVVSQKKFQEGFNSIVEEIESQDTDVVTELYKQKSYYENMLSNVSSDEETEKIHSLINATQN